MLSVDFFLKRLIKGGGILVSVMEKHMITMLSIDLFLKRLIKGDSESYYEIHLGKCDG
jgi:hypothetical protein